MDVVSLGNILLDMRGVQIRCVMDIEEWIRIIRMLLEERHKLLLAELRQLARDNA